jgi:hypothetical protein
MFHSIDDGHHWRSRWCWLGITRSLPILPGIQHKFARSHGNQGDICTYSVLHTRLCSIGGPKAVFDGAFDDIARVNWPGMPFIYTHSGRWAVADGAGAVFNFDPPKPVVSGSISLPYPDSHRSDVVGQRDDIPRIRELSAL